MRIGVLRESAPHEHRVSLVPASAKRLVAAGHAVAVEPGAGASASFPDPEYVSAGATLAGSRAALLSESDVVLGVQRPPAGDLAHLRSGAALVALGIATSFFFAGWGPGWSIGLIPGLMGVALLISWKIESRPRG